MRKERQETNDNNTMGAVDCFTREPRVSSRGGSGGCKHPSRILPWKSIADHHRSIAQPISKSSHGSFEIARLEVLVQVLSLHRSEKISPNEWYTTSWDSSSLIRNLDRNVFLAFNNDDLDWRIRGFIIWAISFNNGSERVLQ
ncbi:hypothetical protein AG1IA_02680 [Rhizoctonia solani AG-1 IA]|uniref:Uncharacterized protein n=1 Tax=Thanatephorus cucumeris (strain AG1-IA) TaxID=983506 RepID=L8X2T5_THACA|nr:hypothetical protein AG1IA_02680 [Rhizoctonia solani AG-1 IA]